MVRGKANKKEYWRASRAVQGVMLLEERDTGPGDRGRESAGELAFILRMFIIVH
jgi:hypothetical protein